MGTRGRRFTAALRAEAVRQAIEKGHPVREVVARLGVYCWSLCKWLQAHTTRRNVHPAATFAMTRAVGSPNRTSSWKIDGDR